VNPNDAKNFASDEEAFLEVDRLIDEGWSFCGNIFEGQRYHLVIERDGAKKTVAITERSHPKMFFPKKVMACSVR
jgi:hypothetical protein